MFLVRYQDILTTHLNRYILVCLALVLLSLRQAFRHPLQRLLPGEDGNIDPLRRLSKSWLVAVLSSYLSLCTMVAISLLHLPPLPRAADQLMRLEVPADEEQELNTKTAALPWVMALLLPAVVLLAPVAIVPKPNVQRGKSFSGYVNEPGTCFTPDFNLSYGRYFTIIRYLTNSQDATYSMFNILHSFCGSNFATCTKWNLGLW